MYRYKYMKLLSTLFTCGNLENPMDFFKLQASFARKMSEAGPDLKALIASHKQQVGELNCIWKSAIFQLETY